MSPSAPPLVAIRAWLAGLGLQPQSVELLAGDVSPRRYLRILLADGHSRIVAWHPPELVDAARRFVVTTGLLAAAGIRVPRILEAEVEAGLLLLEDLGRRNLFESVPEDWELRARWYERALPVLDALGGIERSRVEALNPPLDRGLLRRELDATRDRLFTRLATHPPALERAYEELVGTLTERLAAGEPIACHRDFMVRNLIALPDGELGVLDHQDLRLGPPRYDLASLLNDSWFPPPAVEGAILERAGLRSASLPDYHRAAAQRTLKAAGTFATFAARDDPRYLPLIAPTLQRALSHLGRLPEGADLAPELRRAWADLLQRPGESLAPLIGG